LRTGIRFRPWLIKPNLNEFHQLLGRRTRSWSDLLASAGEVRSRGVGRVLLSLGDGGCLLASPAGRWFAPPVPPAPGVAELSPLGSGDALLGGFLHAVAAGDEEPEALRTGVAAATANLARRGACLMTAAEVRSLRCRVVVRPV
jgi:fructose-1-phosphate kinase PfkB-like protein